MARRGEPSADPSQLVSAYNALVPVFSKYCTLEEPENRDARKVKKWPASASADTKLRNEASEMFGEILGHALDKNQPWIIIELLTSHYPISFRDLLQNHYVSIGLAKADLTEKNAVKSMVVQTHNWRYVASLLGKVGQLTQLRPIIGNAVLWLE